MLVGSGRKYENRSKYKNKTQTAVINIVSYQKTAVFDHISLTLPSPPLPLINGMCWPRLRATSGYGVRIPPMYPVGIRCFRVFQILETEGFREATRN